jgi:type VI protein secretion system component VasK
MPISITKNYVKVVVGGLVSLAAIILIALQWGNETGNFSLYGKVMVVNLALLMLLTAVGGAIGWIALRWVATGSVGIWRYRRQQHKFEKMAEKKAQKESSQASEGSGQG